MALFDTTVGVNDACLLEPLDEDHFVENLRSRFHHSIIYTYIGSVVVSVNPYKQLPLYSRDIIEEYKNKTIYEMAPHIYSITDSAYRSMCERNLDQCVIISGESGAGKTEASKVIMQFVAAVSGKGKEIDRVKEQLLQSNPVLEAFGNAKTLRNDNSSRFGKYMDIAFDFKGDPVGGVISNYLLEKSRVATQRTGERNFHIFYQLLFGADADYLKKLRLIRNPEHYALLSGGGAGVSQGISDSSHFAETKSAMDIIGFSKDEIKLIFELIAAILKLGNIQFDKVDGKNGTSACKVVGSADIEDVCSLIDSEKRVLELALTQRTVEAVRDSVKTDLDTASASYARDALCKALYSRLFSWLITRINDSIKVSDKQKKKSIGVLDIYGFEIFETNGFEQFIINYCNEKLQQLFIELTLKEEQEEYVKEGIEWITVDYFNNAIICDLIEKSTTGILALLDEECLRPGEVSDTTFLNKLSKSSCANSAHFESRSCRKSLSDKTLAHDSFRLIHYAGAVTYKVDGFLDKNNDLLFRDLSRAMYQCKHPLLKLLHPEGNPSLQSLKRPPTAGYQFKVSVAELVKNLMTKSPNYIRCIKPNDYKRSDQFDEKIVRHQIRYLGLMENVRVRRAGYAFRQRYEQFLQRYKMLSPQTWPNWRGRPRDGVVEVLRYTGITDGEYALGRTKIFIRNPRTLFTLEAKRRDKLHDLATLIQTIYRGWHQRQKFLRMRKAQIDIAAQFRCYAARKRYLAQRAAALTICCYARGWKARRIAAKLRYEKKCAWASGIIQKCYKGWRVRHEYRSKFRAVAGPKIVHFLQRAFCYKFLMSVSQQLPSGSPLDNKWPTCAPRFRKASEQLRNIFHHWRCNKYRARLSAERQAMLREKLTTSELFKDKKASYPQSVGVPFRGDVLSIARNPKWVKATGDSGDQKVLFADVVNKINRKNGKMVPHVLVISQQALVCLNEKSMQIKYRIPLAYIGSISVSPLFDKLIVFHLTNATNGNVAAKKGDIVITSERLFEIVTRVYLAIQASERRTINFNIANKFQTTMSGRQVEVSFVTGSAGVVPGDLKIVRKGAKMSVMQS